eukprot:316775-Rhodomonas_salina.1
MHHVCVAAEELHTPAEKRKWRSHAGRDGQRKVCGINPRGTARSRHDSKQRRPAFVRAWTAPVEPTVAIQ